MVAPCPIPSEVAPKTKVLQCLSYVFQQAPDAESLSNRGYCQICALILSDLLKKEVLVTKLPLCIVNLKRIALQNNLPRHNLAVLKIVMPFSIFR